MAIVQRDNVQIFLLQKEDKQTAKEMSLRISVNQIEQLAKELQAKEGEIIHPEGSLETKPWGVKESTASPALKRQGLRLTAFRGLSLSLRREFA